MLHLQEIGVSREWPMSGCGPEWEHNKTDVLQLGEHPETEDALQGTVEALAVLKETFEAWTVDRFVVDK